MTAPYAEIGAVVNPATGVSAVSSFSMVALLWRLLVGVRSASVPQAGRPPFVSRTHWQPAYPAAPMSSCLKVPRVLARPASAGRAFFIGVC